MESKISYSWRRGDVYETRCFLFQRTFHMLLHYGPLQAAKMFPSICQYFKPACWKRVFRCPEFDVPNDRRQTDRPIRHSLIMFCRRVEHSFLIVHPSASLILL